MSIETGLRSKLIDDIGVDVYPLRLPQGYTLPALTYQRVDSPRNPDLSGPTGWVFARFQIDIWGDSYGSVRGLADQVRLSLDGFKGNLSGTHTGGIMMDSERDLFEESTEVYRVTTDFIIPYTENI